MPETKDAEEARPYVWVHADHVQSIQDLAQIMVAVDAETGQVIDPQPEYPVQPEPDPEPPARTVKPTDGPKS